MNILSIQHSLKHKALEIYVAGCAGDPHCEGCHNPESWDFNQGKPWREVIPEAKLKCQQHPRLIDKVWILGGEPIDQDIDELVAMLRCLCYVLQLPVWLFTRYEIQDIPNNVLKFCSYVKCGPYIRTQKTTENIQYGVSLASTNQRIHHFNNESMAFWR
jgi:anaerobic ribonucleoside-triphosphate reductase activating protein